MYCQPLGINNRCHPIWHTSIQVVEQLFRQRVPDFREEFYQSGSYSAGAAGGASDVLVLFVKLLLEDYPDMFDRIVVWRAGRVLVGLNVLLLKPFSNSRCSTYWSIILLKYSIADGVINALRNQNDKVFQQLEVWSTPLHSPISQQRDRKPLDSPPQKQPQNITETSLPFFSVLCAQFSIFQTVF